MTLSRFDRYDAERIDTREGHAVVIGAGVAGLLAARVLADAYARVTVLDSDPLPDEPVARRGVPQADHPHVLLEAGRATIEDLLPGYCEGVLRGGGLLTDWGSDLLTYTGDGYVAFCEERIPMYCASRALFEAELRRRVAALDGITLQGECPVTEYLVDDSAVSGVSVRDSDGERELSTDLVVDATGRTSRTPGWLEETGYDPPPVEEVTIDIAYGTTRLERPEGDRRSFLTNPEPPRYRGCGVFPIEDGEWLVTLSGVHGVEPPTDRDGFLEYARSLPTEYPERFVESHAWATEEIEAYRFPSNLRRRYEALDRFPDGLVVVGDAIASFNPIYGQGMSVAALEALALHHCLADGLRGDVALEFFDRAADAVDIAWNMAVGADSAFPETEGETSLGAEFFDRYVSRLNRKATEDPQLSAAFKRVIMMKEPPSSLFRPGVLGRVLLPDLLAGTAGETDRTATNGRHAGSWSRVEGGL